MFRLLFVFLVIIPIIEITVLMQVGALLGVWPTIGIVIVTAWLGAKYVKQQGLATLQNVQSKMAQGEMPSDEIITGLLLLVAGVLLVTPGFVTDGFGLLLLVPSVRQRLIASVQKHMVMQGGASQGFIYTQTDYYTVNDDIKSVNQSNFSTQHESPASSKKSGDVLDGEFERKE